MVVLVLGPLAPLLGGRLQSRNTVTLPRGWGWWVGSWYSGKVMGWVMLSGLLVLALVD